MQVRYRTADDGKGNRIVMRDVGENESTCISPKDIVELINKLEKGLEIASAGSDAAMSLATEQHSCIEQLEKELKFENAKFVELKQAYDIMNDLAREQGQRIKEGIN